MDILKLIGREKGLFISDILIYEEQLSSIISTSSFLVIGGAGSIGQAVVKEIFKRNPKKLHVVDISENNMVELVRDIRSSFGYIDGEFKTFALDIGSLEYDAFIKQDGRYITSITLFTNSLDKLSLSFIKSLIYIFPTSF